MASFKSLEGLERLAPKKKPVAKKVVVAEPTQPEVDYSTLFTGEPVIVRTPRVVPAARSAAVQKIKDSEHGTRMIATGRLGVAAETQARRQSVLEWMLNGHLYDGELRSVQELASILDVHPKVVESDIAKLKSKMADYHVEGDERDIPALAYMLMEMKFQDRGRALQLHNIIIGDIQEADAAANAPKEPDKPGVKPKKEYALTGRDRAAMYNAALQALDLSSKACNGMDQLFKLTGGAKKLADIIKARQLIINNNNTLVVNSNTLQQFVGQEFAGILPSTRKAQPQLEAPASLTLDADELAVMEIGDN